MTDTYHRLVMMVALMMRRILTMLIAIQMVMVMRLSSIMRKMMMTMCVITCF